MNFGEAIECMKNGDKVSRAGWNGKGMWVVFIHGTPSVIPKEGSPYAMHLGREEAIEILPHFDMYTVDSSGRYAMLPGWLASQSDMNATDWQVVG